MKQKPGSESVTSRQPVSYANFPPFPDFPFPSFAHKIKSHSSTLPLIHDPPPDFDAAFQYQREHVIDHRNLTPNSPLIRNSPAIKPLQPGVFLIRAWHTP